MAETGVDRQIYFYFVNTPRDKKTGKSTDYDPRPYLDTIKSLDASEDGLYMPVPKTSDHLLAVVDDVAKFPRLRWFRARRSDLPEVELSGTFDYLKLDDAAGLADKTHVIFFPKNIIGADFNVRAPRMSSLSRYLVKKGGSPIISIEYLVDRDTLKRLEQLETISLFDLRVTDPQLANLQGTPFHKSFKAMMKDFGAYDVEVVLRKKRQSDEDLGGVKGFIRALARRQPDDQRSAVETLKVRGRQVGGDTTDEIDMLNSRLHAVETIQRIRVKTKVLDTEDAYRAIERAYGELRNQIDASVSFRVSNG